jgi:hypothetical protein
MNLIEGVNRDNAQANWMSGLFIAYPVIYAFFNILLTFPETILQLQEM